MCLAIACCSSSFLAPTTLSTILPSLRNIKVGIASTAQSVATDCNTIAKTCMIFAILNSIKRYNKQDFNVLTFNSSTSTFKKVTVGNFLASSAKNGAMKRQGPHHEAVKSTTICNRSNWASAGERLIWSLRSLLNKTKRNTLNLQFEYILFNFLFRIKSTQIELQMEIKYPGKMKWHSPSNIKQKGKIHTSNISVLIETKFNHQYNIVQKCLRIRLHLISPQSEKIARQANATSWSNETPIRSKKKRYRLFKPMQK